MNTFGKLFAVAAMAAAMPAAFAASTVELTVSGTIIPASCTPTLSATNIHFGKLSAKDLEQDKETRLLFDNNAKSTLSVNCDSATLYALRGIDNRAGTHDIGTFNGTSPYGLGLTGDGEKTGAHFMEIFPSESTIDAKPAFVTVGNAAGTAWEASQAGEKAIRNTGEILGFTDTVGVTTGPIAIKDAAYSLHHYGVIAPASGLTLTDEVGLDGSATIEVVYL